VLITPPGTHGPADFGEIVSAVRRVLAPVDLSSSSVRQVAVAAGVARALDVPLLLTHVVEPLRYPASLEPTMPSINAELRDEADKALADLASSLPADVKREALSLFGDPAEEVAKIARDREAGLIVVGLHGSPFLGPRMGSVTYRVLCLVQHLILAVPPTVALRDVWRTERATTTT
jgi:nucleotide-binding universal stress UspA family protein